ncbi:MAG: M23 family metallopeptidase [Candidatus Kerfeldbacteria bacterium]|nr:M23 family metallopeptidase [Candidatus Kerfeldbacteria bacterium]
MKRLMMLFVAGILMVPGMGWTFDGADYPVGYPNGNGWNRGHGCFSTSCTDFSCSDGLGFLEPNNYGGSIGCVLHPGEDWNKNTGGNTDCGEIVRAMADGQVTSVPSSCSWGTLVIRHDNVPGYGTLYSVYGHMDNAWPGIVVGSNVQRGDQIGTVSDKGLNGAPCHLHFEIRSANLAACFFPTDSGGGNDEDWVRARYIEPTVFINANRPGAVQFAAQLVGQNVSITTWLPPNGTYTLWVDYRNVGSTTWENSGGVTNPNYVELRSVSGTCSLVTSFCAYDASTWTNRQRIGPAQQTSVPTNSTARFQFVARATSTTGECVQWVAPWYSGGCMDGWGGVNFTVRTDATPPTQPVASVDPSTNNTNSFSFSWTASTDEHSGFYRYYWSVNGGGETFTTTTSVPSGPWATQQGTNTFNVRAVDNVGNSASAAPVTFTLTSSPCPGREIPHTCVPSTTCYPAASSNLQTLPDATSAPWSSVGQPVRDMLKPGRTYSIGFEYRSTAATEMKLGFGTTNPASDLGLVINASNLPASTDNEWRTFWSAPFTVTAGQLESFSSLKFVRASTADGFDIRNVRIVAYQ